MPQGYEATQASRGETAKGQQVATLELETPDAITGHPLDARVRRHLQRPDLQTRREILDSGRSWHIRPSLHCQNPHVGVRARIVSSFLRQEARVGGCGRQWRNSVNSHRAILSTNLQPILS